MRMPRWTLGRLMAAIAIGTILVVEAVEVVKLLERRGRYLARAGSAATVARERRKLIGHYQGLVAAARDSKARGEPHPPGNPRIGYPSWDDRIGSASRMVRGFEEQARSYEHLARAYQHAARRPWLADPGR